MYFGLSDKKALQAVNAGGLFEAIDQTCLYR
jgi:hypothetical protein